MTNGNDELRNLIESNARAIEALTSSMQEIRRDRAVLYQLMADLTQNQSRLSNVLENLDNRQGEIVGILRLLTDKIN